MSKSTKKTERKFGVSWVCPNCEGNPAFSHDEMMKHLADVHKIDAKNTKGKRSMLMHMDGSDWFSYQWEWEINGLKFIQNTCQKRDAKSQAYWQ